MLPAADPSYVDLLYVQTLKITLGLYQTISSPHVSTLLLIMVFVILFRVLVSSGGLPFGDQQSMLL